MAFGKGQGAATAQTVTIKQQGTQTFLGGVPRQNGILVLGGGLIALNFLLDPRGVKFMNAWLGTNIQARVGEETWGGIGAQLALLIFLYILASLDEEAGTFALVLVLGMWVLWYFNALGPGLFGSNTKNGAPPQQGGGKTGPN